MCFFTTINSSVEDMDKGGEDKRRLVSLLSCCKFPEGANPDAD